NRAARVLLKAHIAKPLSQTWRYAANVAIETICRTFAIAPSDSEAALLALMAPTRLAQFPHDDLRALAENLHRLTPLGGNVILRVFEAAFQGEPATGSWENFGGRILSMRIQTSDQWNSIHYNLAEFYQRYNGDNARVATEAACIAWNAT